MTSPSSSSDARAARVAGGTDPDAARSDSAIDESRASALPPEHTADADAAGPGLAATETLFSVDVGVPASSAARPAVPLPSLPPPGPVRTSIGPGAELESGLSFPPIATCVPDSSQPADGADVAATQTDGGGGGAGLAPATQPSLPAAAEGRYEVLRQLAQGGMGAILMAFDRRLGRVVAMKVVRRDRTARKGVRIRFLREAQVHGQLEHPNIVPVHDLVASGDTDSYFTMKLVRGESLATLISRVRRDVLAGKGEGSLPLGERLNVFRKVCDAIAFANNRQVVHRDLKPDNIMVGEFGEVQVMDWGLSRVLAEPDADRQLQEADTDAKAGSRHQTSLHAPGERGTEVHTHPGDGGGLERTQAGESGSGSPPSDASTSTRRDSSDSVRVLDEAAQLQSVDGEVMGTLQYMAPEQARGNLSDIDARTDVYALGAILYELLVLSPAIEATNAWAMIHDAATGRFPRPTRRLRDTPGLRRAGIRVPAELEAVVMKAMAKDRESRYQTAAELGSDVAHYMEGRLVGAARYSMRQRVTKWVRAHRTAVAVSALLLLGIVGVLIATAVSGAMGRASLLADMRAGLDAANARLEQVAADSAAGRYQAAVTAATAFDEDFGADLIAVTNNTVVRSERTEWIGEAAALRERAGRERDKAVLAWARAGIDALPAVDSAAAARAIPMAREHFTRFRDLTAIVSDSVSLPTSGFAWWLASVYDRIANERESRLPADADELARSAVAEAEREVADWVAAAWQLEPGSTAAGRCMLLLAERQLRRGPPPDDLLRVAAQFELAYRSLRDSQRGLALRGVIGLVTTLMAMPPTVMPDDTGIGAHEVALRALLQLVQPDGTFRDEVAGSIAAAVGSAARDALNRRARELLMVLRRTAGGVLATPVTAADPASPGTLLSLRGRDLMRLTLVAPALYGNDAPIVTDQQRIGGDYPGLTVFAPRPGDATAPAAAWQRGDDLVLASDLSTMEQTGRAMAVHQPVCVQLADINGDGLADLVYGAHTDRERVMLRSAIVVLFGGEDGFDDDRVAMGTDTERAGEIGELRALRTADLDGDGRDDVIVVRRRRLLPAMLEVHRFDNQGHIVCADAVALGDTHPAIVDTPSGPLIAVSPHVSDLEGLAASVAKESVPTQPRLFRLVGGVLTEVAVPWQLDARDRATASEPGFERVALDEGYVALIDRFSRGRGPDAWAADRWMLLGEDGRAVALRVGTDARSLGDGLIDTRHGVMRRLRDADLTRVANRPIGASTDPPLPEEPELALARLLLWLEQPDTVLRRTSPDGLSPSGAVEWHRVRMQTLAQAGRLRELLAAAGELPIRSQYVPHLLGAVDTVLELTGRYEALLPLLERWAASRRLNEGERQRLLHRLNPVRAVAEALATQTITITGPRVARRQGAAGSGRKESVSRLSKHFLCNTLDLVRLAPDATLDEPGDWRVMSGGHPPGLGDIGTDRIPSLVSDMFSPDGGWRVAREPRFAGVPVAFRGDTWRVTYDMTIEYLAPGSHVDFGVQALRAADIAPPVGVEIRRPDRPGTGSLDDAGLLATLVGRRIRVVREALAPLGITRLTVYDVDTGAPVLARVEPIIGSMRWPIAVIGPQVLGHQRTELRIHGIRIDGPVDVLKADGAEVVGLVHAVTTRLATRAQQARFDGRHLQAAELLLELADYYDEAGTALKGMLSSHLIDESWTWAVESVWSTGYRDRDAFMAVLDDLLLSVAEARDIPPGAVGNAIYVLQLSLRALTRPHLGGELDWLAGVGDLLARRRFEASDALELVRAGGLERGVSRQVRVAVLAAAVSREPGDTNLRHQWATAIRDAATYHASIGNDRLLLPLDALYIEATTPLRDAHALDDELAGWRLVALDRLGRRAQVLAEARPGDDKTVDRLTGATDWLALQRAIRRLHIQRLDEEFRAAADLLVPVLEPAGDDDVPSSNKPADPGHPGD